jgi:hypothetical protein
LTAGLDNRWQFAKLVASVHHDINSETAAFTGRINKPTLAEVHPWASVFFVDIQ